jgi:cytochrome P450 family 6
MRNKLSPTFTSGKMKMMYSTMHDVSNVMIKVAEASAKSGTTIDAKTFTSRFTLDIISLAAFGLDLNSLENPEHEMIGYAKQVLDFSGAFKQMKMMFMNTFPELARLMNVWITPPEFAEYFTKVMTETVAYREKNQIVRHDFLNLLLQIKNNGKLDDGENLGKITFNELMAQSTVFLVAGFETSATAMMFALYELAVNPDVQSKLRANVVETLKKHDGKLTYEAIMDMEYLGYVVTETLRKYPSVPTLFRTTAEDYAVPGRNITIEKGTQIFIPVYAIHHNPEFYPEPEVFKPERWLPEEVQKRPAMSYLTFGDGPRNCIGMRFGLLQIRLGLARLVERYNIMLNGRTSTPLKLDPKDICKSRSLYIFLKSIFN